MADARTIAIVGIGIFGLSQVLKKKKGKRRSWCKKWLRQRDRFSHMSLLRELQENNPDDYRNYLRMTDDCFNQLLTVVSPYILKKDTLMRDAINPEQRLIATLRYLATGRSLQDLKFTTGISPQALGVIIPETCLALIKVLQPEYIKFPSSPEQWKEVAVQFNEKWNFPNCGGAIDGKHVRIVPPPNSGSYYYNYKGFFSIVLLAVVNANYEFIFLDIGKNGRNSDGGVIDQTEFHRRMQNGTLNLPTCADNVEQLNFVFVADEAFALGEHLLKPYPMRNLTPEQKIFNYRLSRARRVVENAFGIMANRFRLFLTAINLALYKVDNIVLCCCILHNYLRRHADSYMATLPFENDPAGPGRSVVQEAHDPTEGLTPIGIAHAGLPSQSARVNRNNYLNYFQGIGAVDWQADR